MQYEISLATLCPESYLNSSTVIRVRLKNRPDVDVKFGSPQQQLIRSED